VKHLVRTFVGLRCGKVARQRLLRSVARLRGEDQAVKLAPIEDLHITLQYLGATPQEDITVLAEALETAAAGFAPIEVAYLGLGAFPDVARPRVVWAGIDPDLGGPSLTALSAAVARALRDVGYRPERRAFHPHVTLARVHRRPEARVLQELAAAAALDLGEEILSDLKLMLSDPGHRPYHYIDLTTVSLEG